MTPARLRLDAPAEPGRTKTHPVPKRSSTERSPPPKGAMANRRERWLPIARFPGYEVSDLGRVRVLPRRVQFGKQWRWTKARVLSLLTRKDGYVRARIGPARPKVHLLVLESFVGPRPGRTAWQSGSGPLIDGCHVNDDKNNNCVSNLKWATRQENIQDCIRNGRHDLAYRRRIGVRCRLLTDAQVQNIRERLVIGVSRKPGNQRALAMEFGVSVQLVSLIGKGYQYVSKVL